jgi:hypothetical protein
MSTFFGLLVECCEFAEEDQMNKIQGANEVAHHDEDEDEEEDFEVRNQYNHTLRSSASYVLCNISKQFPQETAQMYLQL